MSAWLVALAMSCGPSPPPSGEAGPSASTPESVEPRPQWPSWGGVPWPTGDDALAAALRQAELHRDPAAEAIEQAWRHQDPAWRARAAWALARVGGTQARERFTDWLGDGRVALDAPTLAAVSLLPAPGSDESRHEGWDELEDRLWTRYAVTDDRDEAAALLLAIARVGGSRSPGRLAADLAALPGADDEPRYVHGMEALAILCVRGHPLLADGLRAVAQGLASPTPEPRRAAAHTLARCAAVSAEQLAGAERGALVERLAPMTADEDDAEGARRAWRALEGLGELPTVVPGWVLGEEPGDWMAEVAAVRALAAHADGRKVLARRLPQVKLAAFTGPRLHVLRELLEQLRPFIANDGGLAEPLTSLRPAVKAAIRAAGADAGRIKALTLIGCELELLLAIRSGTLDALRSCPASSDRIPVEHGEALTVEALVHMSSALPREQRVAALIERAADPRARVAAPALGALAGVDDPAVAAALRQGLARDDMGVVAAAAGAVATRAADHSRRDPQAATELLAVIERFDNDHAVETRIAAIDALGRLARSETSAQGEAAADEPPVWLERLATLARDPAVAVRAAARRAFEGHPSLLEAFDAAANPEPPGQFAPAVHQAVDRLATAVAGLRLHTDAGAITIDFSGAPAPIAQANLTALAEAGFFDGVVFHRVVPGFVIQGGDPRGDGYGGPGHVMPCEWSSLRYERGTVGIALAGKDTGGSQLFIAHDRPRHLDARYTVIGRVVDGIEVVDAIWPYDRILRVERLDDPPAAGDGSSAP